MEQREATLKMQQVIGRMSNMRASQTFTAWQAYAGEQAARKQQLRKATIRLQRLRCSAVLFGWARLVKQSKAVQGRLIKAVR